MAKKNKFSAATAGFADELAEFETAPKQTYPEVPEEPAPPAKPKEKPRMLKKAQPKKPEPEEPKRPGPTPPAYRANAELIGFSSRMVPETRDKLRWLKTATAKREVDLLEEALQDLFAKYKKKGVSIPSSD